MPRCLCLTSTARARLAASAGLVAVMLACGVPSSAPDTRFLVLCDDAELPAAARALIEDAGGRVEHEWPEIQAAAIGGIAPADAEALRGLIGVEQVTPNIEVQWIPPAEELVAQFLGLPAGLAEAESLSDPAMAEIDPALAESNPASALFFDRFQWNMRQVRADEAWQTTRRGEDTLVCVLDTGIDPTHIDLRGKVLPFPFSVSLVPSEPFIHDLHFHGSFVAGLISSRGIGVASVAPEASLCAIKVIGLDGRGPISNLIGGVLHATFVGANVVNMSVGVLVPRAGFEELFEPLQQAIDSAISRGVVVVSSAGNNGINFDQARDLIHVPSMLDGVLSVGATGPFDQSDFDARASYSNFGRRGIDVVAPGGSRESGNFLDGVISVCARFAFIGLFILPCAGSQSYLSGAVGTSFSSPMAAGAAAVALGEGNPDAHHCVRQGADPITGRSSDPEYGHGRIDVVDAARCNAFARGNSAEGS